MLKNRRTEEQSNIEPMKFFKQPMNLMTTQLSLIPPLRLQKPLMPPVKLFLIWPGFFGCLKDWLKFHGIL
jgi:hypothetical protein